MSIQNAKLTNSAIFYRTGVPNSSSNFGYLVATNNQMAAWSYKFLKNNYPPTPPIIIVDLSPFFPSITDQKFLDACECYSMVYNIANYYQMLLSLKLNPTNWQTFHKYKKQIDKYYNKSDPLNPQNNIINPLFTWNQVQPISCQGVWYVGETGTGRLPQPFMVYRTIIKGCATYSSYNLNYIAPQPVNDSPTSPILGCPPTINNGVNAYPILPNSSMVILFDVFNPYPYSTTFNLSLVQSYLNKGLPLLFTVYLNKLFIDQLLLYNNRSNYHPKLTTAGLWYNNTNDPNSYIYIANHLMVICGYIDNLPVAYEADGSSGVFIFINTFSTTFGNNGIGYITYNYFFNCFNTNIEAPFSNGAGPLIQLSYLPINM